MGAFEPQYLAAFIWREQKDICDLQGQSVLSTLPSKYVDTKVCCNRKLESVFCIFSVCFLSLKSFLTYHSLERYCSYKDHFNSRGSSDLGHNKAEIPATVFGVGIAL